MTPGARLQAVIEILDALDGTVQPADRYIREWFRARRYAGSKDRAAVSERVFGVLRRRVSLAWRMRSGDTRAAVIASLLSEGTSADEVGHLFAGEGYGPPALSDDERAAIAFPPAEAPPSHVLGDFPAWLEPELKRAFGETVAEEMQAMVKRAPVDVRVNTLRATRHDMLVGLRALDVKAEPTPCAPHGIRIPSAEGLSQLQHTQFFQTGAFEFQDEASQIASLLCAPKPGMRVLDLAAGGGGKSLALAAAMGNDGEVLAFDDKSERLREAGPRARRAGATIIKVVDKRGGPLWGNGKFDIVLVDAPCSGSGTWRRNPELKWRLTPERLRELTAVQASLLDDGARHVLPGGRLVYATCSLLPKENEDTVDAFLARRPEFRRIGAADIWQSLGYTVPPGMEREFRATPLRTGTDGFFTSVLQHVED